MIDNGTNWLVRNELRTRAELFSEMLNIGKDINASCGYPTFVTINDYVKLYSREGIAKRVVNIYPEESWKVDPIVIEDEKSKDTAFESAWKELEAEFNIYHYLQRVDKLSGIGRFGVLLMGLSDGLELNEPVVGSSLKLLFLKSMSEQNVKVLKNVTDVNDPRFGFPELYSIQFDDTSQLNVSTSITRTVHWSRLLHVADNREDSEVYGTPRMEPVYNRLLDIRKILSGSGEMYWKGAFPGYSFEVNKDVKNPTLDKESIRAEFLKLSSGLQRYIALEGVTAKSLDPQVSDPGPHLKSQLEYIAISLGIPMRIFLGSEQAKLASVTDKDTHNDRLQNRQRKYIAPMIIRQMIDRLMVFGTLPAAKYVVEWPDLFTPSERDKAEVAKLRTDAFAKYVTSGVDGLIPEKEYLMLYHGLSEEEANAIDAAVSRRMVDDDSEVDDE